MINCRKMPDGVYFEKQIYGINALENTFIAHIGNISGE